MKPRLPTDLSAILAKGSHSFREANKAVESKGMGTIGGIWKAFQDSGKRKPGFEAVSELPKESIAYAEQAFIDFVVAAGLPPPLSEHRFAPPRRFRFDYAWLSERVALEVNGGVWSRGRHTRGAGFIRDMEKASLAATLGWRLVYCQPQDLLKPEIIETIRKALEFKTNL